MQCRSQRSAKMFTPDKTRQAPGRPRRQVRRRSETPCTPSLARENPPRPKISRSGSPSKGHQTVSNECTGTRVQHAAARAEKLDPNVSPVEKAIAHDRDLLIINPDSFPLGPDRHREPVVRPA